MVGNYVTSSTDQTAAIEFAKSHNCQYFTVARNDRFSSVHSSGSHNSKLFQSSNNNNNNSGGNDDDDDDDEVNFFHELIYMVDRSVGYVHFDHFN